MLPLTSSTLGFLLAMGLFPAVQQRAQAELERVLGVKLRGTDIGKKLEGPKKS